MQNLALLPRLTIRTSNYSCLSASIGSIAAAFIAGYNPNTTPAPTEIDRDNPIDQGAILGSNVETIGGSVSGDAIDIPQTNN